MTVKGKARSEAIRTKKQNVELLTNKMLLTFGVTAVYLFAVTILRNQGIIFGIQRSTVEIVIYAAVMAALLALIPVGCLLYWRQRCGGQQPQQKLLNWLNAALASATVLPCTALQYLFGVTGVKATYVIVIAAAALAITYWVARKECFASLCVLGGSAVTFYLLYRLPLALSRFMDTWKVLAVLYMLVWALTALMFWFTRRGKGTLKLGRRSFHLFHSGTRYWPVFAALIATALMFAVCMLLGVAYFYYALMVCGVLMAACIVYFILLIF